ncbi:GMC oxidoreductase [Diplocarpon mali]|nr:GMC oxidoreductase [Diplocarpon mali]
MKRLMNFTSANTEWYGDAGIGNNKKWLDGNPLGVFYHTSSVDPTRKNRSYSTNPYLPLAGPSHIVMSNTRVTKIDFNKIRWGYTATGVTLTDMTIIIAQKEVIISAGSYQSPSLLEVWGWAGNMYKGFFSLLAIVMHPFSRGSVQINATDLLETPVTNSNYQSNERDIQAIIAAIKKCRQIALTPPLSEVWVSEYEPGLETVNTDAEWREFALRTTLSIYRLMGTCAMLPRKKGGVVDSKLRVYGKSNLKGVDASIFPVLVSAHIQTANYGIAEMAADITFSEAETPNQV